MIPDEVARPLYGTGDRGVPPPIAKPLRPRDEHPTVQTTVLPGVPRDRMLWKRVLTLCTDVDRVYFDGRNEAFAADEISLVIAVVRGLEEHLAKMHRLIIRTRTLSVDGEDLLACDLERLEAHLDQHETLRRENLTLSTACRRLHEEACSVERQLRETTKRVARQSVGRMEAAHMVERIRELEAELAAARRKLARAEQRLVGDSAAERTPVDDESERLRRRLAAAERQVVELEQDNDRLIRERDELHADLAAARTEMISRVRSAG